MEGCQFSGMTAYCMTLLLCQAAMCSIIICWMHTEADVFPCLNIQLQYMHGGSCLKAFVALQSQQARGGYADKHEHDFSHAP